MAGAVFNSSLRFVPHQFVIHYPVSSGRLTAKHAPLIRADLRIWLKIRVFLVMVKFVNAYVERDKKKFKKMDFALTPLRELFEAKNSQF